VDQSNQKRPAESHLTYLDFPETSVRESGYRDDSPAPLTPMNGTGNVPTDFRTILRNRDLDEYLAAEELYRMATGGYSSKPAKRLNMCGSSAMFMRDKETGMVKVSSSACHLRFCPMCARKRASEVSDRIYEWLKEQENPRFITLTLRHSHRRLDEQISDLLDSWRRLYKSDEWNRWVRAGVWVLQITYNRKRCEWHPHLHILTVGKFYPIENLRRDWKRASRGSYIVDIEGIGQPEQAAKYVGRYVGRACKLTEIPKSRWIELYWGIKGRRLFGEFGTGKGEERLLRRTKRSELSEWEPIGFFSDVVKSAPFDQNAFEILSAWKYNRPLPKLLKIPKRIVDYNLQGELMVWEFLESGEWYAYQAIGE